MGERRFMKKHRKSYKDIIYIILYKKKSIDYEFVKYFTPFSDL
jgi:hypothetical protein